MYFDTHAHLDDAAFDEDRDEMLERIREAGVDRVLNPGCDENSTRMAMELAEKHDFVFFAAGFHPEELSTLTEESYAVVCELARHPKCLAVGEIGLDYYWDASHKEEQKALFDRQLLLALELEKPVIIHDREAHGDCLAAVRRHPELRGVFHCYSGSAEMAEELLRLGWYLGFDGPVTYKNARKALEVLQICPVDRILVETDSPYLSPVPMRGRRNDPGNLPWICAKISEVKGLTAEEIARITAENGCRLFGLS